MNRMSSRWSDTEWRNLQIRIPLPLFEELRKEVKARGITLTSYVSNLIYEELKAQEKK